MCASHVTPPQLNVKSEKHGDEIVNRQAARLIKEESKSSPALEPARRAHHGHGLIHHPLADAKVVIDPALHFLVLGDLFGFETGAGNNPHARDPVHGVCVRVNRVSWTVFLVKDSQS